MSSPFEMDLAGMMAWLDGGVDVDVLELPTVRGMALPFLCPPVSLIRISAVNRRGASELSPRSQSEHLAS